MAATLDGDEQWRMAREGRYAWRAVLWVPLGADLDSGEFREFEERA